MPRAQQNERSALCLLALTDLTPAKSWSQAKSVMIGITPIMNWIRENYGKMYAPNTRETIRRQTMHQFVDGGIALYNPDKPDRPVNSPKAVYQIEPNVLNLLKKYGTQEWNSKLERYLDEHESLKVKYARERTKRLIPAEIPGGGEIALSPGEHSELIRAVIEEFAPRFVPGATLIYAGDTGTKWSFFDDSVLTSLGVSVESHGKMPDVIFYDIKRNWLVLVEAVTSHGPVDGKRHGELKDLFQDSQAGLVFVTAFQNRATMGSYISEIAWETEVWVAEAPSHLIHFDGERFLGPYE